VSEPLAPSASPSRGAESDNESPVETAADHEVNEVEDKEEDGVEVGGKRKLTSAVWNDYKRVKFNGTVRAKCIYCFKLPSATSGNGTKPAYSQTVGSSYVLTRLA